MKPRTKDLLKMLAWFGGCTSIFTALCIFLGLTLLEPSEKRKEENPKDTVERYLDTLHTYEKEVEMHVQECNDLLKQTHELEEIATQCTITLHECVDTLEHHAVILPMEKEKK